MDPMARLLRRLAFCFSVAVLFAAGPAYATRVKDLTDVVGVRENALYGYGLVVGLAGTGDTVQVLFTQQSVAGMLGRLGIASLRPTCARTTSPRSWSQPTFLRSPAPDCASTSRSAPWA